jgi:thiosulfate/3-mercaptopyruvate sulfurtransferase
MHMAQTYPYPGGDSTVKWVSTDWLGQHLQDKDLTILDTQPNIHEYVKEHIPGALYANEGLFRIHTGMLPTGWIAPEAAQILMQTLGLDAGKPVVVYTSSGHLTKCEGFVGDGLEQTFLAYTLARFGHNHVYVLDGGLDKWRAEKRPMTQKYPETRPSSIKASVRSDYFITYDEFLRQKDKPDAILLDARPAAFYEGQGPWSKPGHIPGAVSLPWKSLMDPNNSRLLKPEAEIKAMLKEKGISPDKLVICSCGTGREATNEFILFKFYLGYPKVKLYEGSYTEWLTHPENPTVTGKNPR